MRRVCLHAFALMGALALISGCGESSTTSTGGTLVTPPAPAMTKTDGHLTREQRGLSLDEYDLQVLGTEISADDLNQQFGLLALHVKYINWPIACVSEGEGPNVQPRATVAERLEEIEAAGIDLANQGIHVNVDDEHTSVKT